MPTKLLELTCCSIRIGLIDSNQYSKINVNNTPHNIFALWGFDLIEAVVDLIEAAVDLSVAWMNRDPFCWDN